LLVVEYESLTSSQKDLYKFCFIKDAIVKECKDFRKYVMSPMLLFVKENVVLSIMLI